VKCVSVRRRSALHRAAEHGRRRPDSDERESRVERSHPRHSSQEGLSPRYVRHRQLETFAKQRV